MERGYLRTDRIDGPRQVPAKDIARLTGQQLGERAGPDHKIGGVDRGGVHLDPNLPPARFGHRNVGDAQNVGTSKGADGDGPHGCSSFP